MFMMDVRAQEKATVQDESDFDAQMVTKGTKLYVHCCTLDRCTHGRYVLLQVWTQDNSTQKWTRHSST